MNAISEIEVDEQEVVEMRIPFRADVKVWSLEQSIDGSPTERYIVVKGTIDEVKRFLQGLNTRTHEYLHQSVLRVVYEERLGQKLHEWWNS